jgi:hypothetical protein
MTRGHGPVQPDWGNPNRVRRTARPDNPFDGHQGSRAMAGSPAGRGKGTGAALTLAGVTRLKAVVDL